MKFYVDYEEVTKEQAIEMVGRENVEEGIYRITVKKRFGYMSNSGTSGHMFEVKCE